ncbi:hypothetical protein [Chryseobacterium salivictor]|uniref:hypothetical protein n=1 Tax=Chryseobacterium salivictor TaxID=2547600 RepID=UPI0016258580|nr:hypothetical protein [Chryseobacterium salivictor]
MNRASSEVNGFSELIQRFERNISIQGKSPRTFDNYSRHVAAIVRNIEGVKDSNLMDKLFSKNWVVYAKRPFTITIFGQRGPPQDFLFVTQPLSAK